MRAEYRMQAARGGLIVMILLGTVIGILLTVIALSGVADTWSDGSLLVAILAIMLGFFGAMVLSIRFATRQVVYTVTEEGLREEIRPGQRRSRVRQVAWTEVQQFRAYTQAYTDLAMIRLRTSRGQFSIYAARDHKAQAAFAPFREAALFHLRAHGVPVARPSRARQLAMRGLAWALLAVLIVIPIYVLSLPADQRPDIWWLRWLVVVGLVSPFIGGLLGGERARE